MPTCKEIIQCCIHSNVLANVGNTSSNNYAEWNGGGWGGGGEGPGEQYVDTLYDYVKSPTLNERN
jgi:hypothetical protein